MNKQQQLRLLIRQHTEESCHHAREAQRLEIVLLRHKAAKSARRSGAIPVNDGGSNGR